MSDLKVNAELSDVRMKTDNLKLSRGEKTFNVRMKAENLGVT